MSLTPEQRELLAIAYLTGQATEAQRKEFEARMASDPEFRKTVHEIETWLAPLNTLVPEAKPPAGLLDEIMAEIGALESDKAPSIKPVKARATFNPWQPAALVASLVACISTGLHFVPSAAPVESQPDLVALMSDQSAPSFVIVVYDPVERRVIAQSANVELPSDLVWQLWLIREGSEAPQSLGLLERSQTDRRVELTVSQDLRAQSDLLAISLEPAGGSPTDGPTGPVLFTGQVRIL